MPFTYTDVTIEQLPWRVPVLLPHQPPKKLPEGEFFPSHTARNTREYEAFMHRSLHTLEGKVIVDICSGKGNLDELADHNHLIRVDPLYSSPELRRRLTRDSRCPDKITLIPGSAFRIPVASHSADLVLESFGTTHYFPYMVQSDHIGSNDLPAPSWQYVDDFLLSKPKQQRRRAQRAVYQYFCSVKEKLRILKPGGLSIMGPVVDMPFFFHLIMPSLRRMLVRNLIDLEQETDGNETWLYITSRANRGALASEVPHHTQGFVQTLP